MLTDLDQSGVSFFITEPDNLEGGVGGNITTGIVVDGFARTTEKTGGAIFFPEDQIRIGFRALQGHSDLHLPHGAAGQGVRATQSLGPHDGMDAEGTALPDDSVEEQRGVLGQFVVFNKQLLEFIDHQEDARHGGLIGK